MSTKTQLLKEAKMLETKLANVNKQIARAEKLRMQMLAGVITESQYKARLSEEEGKHIILETMIYADYSTGGGIPEVKFARVLADNVMAGYNKGDINGLYSEGEMDVNGDEFYASLDMSKRVFTSLPNTFTITAELVDEEPFIFDVEKTGPNSYQATER
jgi:hypothetical protein